MSTYQTTRLRPWVIFCLAGPGNLGMWAYSLFMNGGLPRIYWAEMVPFLLAPTCVLAAILIWRLPWQTGFGVRRILGETLLAWGIVTVFSPFIVGFAALIPGSLARSGFGGALDFAFDVYGTPEAIWVLPLVSLFFGWASALTAIIVVCLAKRPGSLPQPKEG